MSKLKKAKLSFASEYNNDLQAIIQDTEYETIAENSEKEETLP